jgi:hypothetical protein
MRTEEELGQRIGARLRAEAADLEVRHDMMLAAIRRRRSRTAAVRGGAVAAGAAVLVATAATLATASGGAQPGSPVHAGATAPSAAGQPTRVQLDGYLLSVPAGLSVQKVGAGYVARGQAGAFMVFLESGPSVGLEPGLGGVAPVQVQAGGNTGWWLGNSKEGELWLREPSLPAHEFLVAKVLGVNESQVLAFAASLNLSTMPVVTVPDPTAGG